MDLLIISGTVVVLCLWVLWVELKEFGKVLNGDWEDYD